MRTALVLVIVGSFLGLALYEPPKLAVGCVLLAIVNAVLFL